LTARPLAPCTVCERPRMGCAITNRLHQVTQRAAGAWDHHRLTFGLDCALAVYPNNLALVLTPSDAVVAAVPEEFGFGSQRFGKAPGDECTIGFRPANGQVMFSEVGGRRKGLGIQAIGLMLVHINAQDGFTQTPRPAVDQNNQLPLAKAELLECLGIQHFFDPLQLGKMVAAPNSTKRLVKLRGLKLRCSEDFAHIAVPRMLQVE